MISSNTPVSYTHLIVPANTFIATAWGPTYAGATPVFVEMCIRDRYYRPSDIPFYYLPLWIIMTTPLFLQLLLGTGLVFQVKNMYIRVIRKIKFEGVTWNKLFLLLCMIIPIIYVVLFSPTLYNGWRRCV